MDGKMCVLLVDENQSDLILYRDYLVSQGFLVYTEASSESALARLISDHKMIDMLIVDILAAKHADWQLLDYVRKNLNLVEAKFPIIVTSAIASLDLEMEYIRHKANDWISKPVKPMAKLLDKMRALLGWENRESMQ